MKSDAQWISDDGRAVLYCGDCREILPLVSGVETCITDPPYGERSVRWSGR
jgi:hypothetical protein